MVRSDAIDIGKFVCRQFPFLPYTIIIANGFSIIANFIIKNCIIFIKKINDQRNYFSLQYMILSILNQNNSSINLTDSLGCIIFVFLTSNNLNIFNRHFSKATILKFFNYDSGITAINVTSQTGDGRAVSLQISLS